MGSLVGGWDATRPGRAPKGFEDYKEPYTPRSRPSGPSPFDAFASEETDRRGSGCLPGSPPSLARVSAPPAIHGASAVQRYLSRSSSSQPSSPRASTPRAGTPRSAKHMTLKFFGDGEEEVQLGEKVSWCSHVDSALLNLRPDVVDKEALHGGFKMDDPCHALHLPGSPRAAEAAAAAAMSPFTPHKETVTVSQVPRVTATRLPKGATQSFESAAL